MPTAHYSWKKKYPAAEQDAAHRSERRLSSRLIQSASAIVAAAMHILR